MKSRFNTRGNMMDAFNFNYGNDPKTVIGGDTENGYFIRYRYGDICKSGDGPTIERAVADFYKTEMPAE